MPEMPWNLIDIVERWAEINLLSFARDSSLCFRREALLRDRHRPKKTLDRPWNSSWMEDEHQPHPMHAPAFDMIWKRKLIAVFSHKNAFEIDSATGQECRHTILSCVNPIRYHRKHKHNLRQFVRDDGFSISQFNALIFMVVGDTSTRWSRCPHEPCHQAHVGCEWQSTLGKLR